MKTSLIIDDAVFRSAKSEAARTDSTISQVISEWARVGREVVRARASGGRRKLPKALDLGGPPRVDLSSRRHWMSVLDEE